MKDIVITTGDGRELKGLYQWDINQKICISGIETSPPPEIHFWACRLSKALVVPTQVHGDKVIADVPNILLQVAEPITIFIYKRTGEDGHRTSDAILCPVRARPQPEEYEYQDNIEYTSWVELTEEARELIDQIDEIMSSMSGIADQALTYATSAGDSASSANTAKLAAELAQGKAEDAQAAAELAQGKAEDAQEAAEAVLESIPESYDELVDDMDNFKRDLVLVQSTQPASEDNRLWVVTSTGEEVSVPTDAEFHAAVDDLQDTVNGKAPAIYAAFGSTPIAAFNDGAAGMPIETLTVYIEDVQSGTGDPSPDNIRPISGWTGANVARTGANIWDEEWEIGGISTSTGGNIAQTDRIRSKSYIPIKPGTAFNLHNGSGKNINAYYYDSNKAYVTNTSYGTAADLTIVPNYPFMRFIVAATTQYGNNISINYPATDHYYHSGADNTTYPITFPDSAGTVYSGRLTIHQDGTGELVKDWAGLILDGVTNKADAFAASGDQHGFALNVGNLVPYSNRDVYAISSHFRGASYAVRGDRGADCTIFPTNSNGRLRIRYDALDAATSEESLANFNGYLADQVTAGTPVQVVYKLKTTEVYDLTAEQVVQIKLLAGVNNVWSNAGNVYVRYPVDTQTQLTMLSDDIGWVRDDVDALAEDVANTQWMIATVEESDTASKDYAVGDLLIYDGQLYKVTSAITLGSTIIPDGNVEQTTVEQELSVANNDVTDVQVNGTSVVQNGVANIPVASTTGYGAVKLSGASSGINSNNNGLYIGRADLNSIKAGSDGYRPITPINQHNSVFYGLAKAAGDTTQSASSNAVGTYTDSAKTAIQTMLNVPDKSDIPEVPVDDVQIDGTSIVSNGVASIPYASQTDGGVVKIIENGSGGFQIQNGYLLIKAAELFSVKAGSVNTLAPIVPGLQDAATFYGLAKAAGADEKNSALPAGQYTDAAKSAIHDMLNAPVTVSGTTPTIAAKSGINYVCGEVSTLTITLPASGIFDVRFTSGSTPTVLTTNGVTWPAWFDPTALEANTIYEINVLDGLAVVATWAT